MKFEQAYYTWSKKLLSAHQQGLGIVASSMKAPEFLDCCERLAMDIKTGPDGETARLLYYDFCQRQICSHILCSFARMEAMGGIIACARC